MRRIVALVLALLLCFGSTVAFAEISLDDLSAEELLALRDQINALLLERGIEKEVVVITGTYIVGEDIPAGTYTITPVSEEEFGFFNVRDENGDIIFATQYKAKAPIGKLVLSEGQTVEINACAAVFSKYKGLGF